MRKWFAFFLLILPCFASLDQDPERCYFQPQSIEPNLFQSLKTACKNPKKPIRVFNRVFKLTTPDSNLYLKYFNPEKGTLYLHSFPKAKEKAIQATFKFIPITFVGGDHHFSLTFQEIKEELGCWDWIWMLLGYE